MPIPAAYGADEERKARTAQDEQIKKLWEEGVSDERILARLDLQSHQLSAAAHRLELPKRAKYLSTIVPDHAIGGTSEKYPLNGGKILGKVPVPLSERHRIAKARLEAEALAKAKRPAPGKKSSARR